MNGYSYDGWHPKALQTVEELEFYHQYYLCIPHLGQIDKVTIASENFRNGERLVFKRPFKLSEVKTEFEDANIGERTRNNDNMIFGSYWWAWAYLQQWRATARGKDLKNKVA